MPEKRNDAALVLSQSQAIIDAQDLLRTPVEELSPDGQVTAWSVLDLIEKELVGPRKEALRAKLLEMAGEGKDNGKGSKSVSVAGATVTKQARGGKVVFDQEKLRATLEAKGLPTNTVFVERTVYEFNEKAVEGLIAAGRLSQADLKEFTRVGDPTYALVVKKAEKVLALLPPPKQE